MTFETWMIIIWFAVFVIGIIVEALTDDLVSIWFSAGALIALVLALIPPIVWWVELIVFFVISVIFILTLRPATKKWMKRSDRHTNVDGIIGQRGKITKEITDLDYGEVKIHGVIWTAMSSDAKLSVSEGTIIEVVAIDGNKVIVKPVE